ncbi:MAG: alternative ribosome rescue aminoacyl-tRNA hydrolase ArfB, partial [Pseudomonadota bacterium]
MIEVTPDITLNDDEVQERFIRAAGPGGQNVNKVSTAVELRFDVRGSPSLPNDVAIRLMKLGGRKVTLDGVLVLVAMTHRTQERNRADALARLLDLIRQAAEP